MIRKFFVALFSKGKNENSDLNTCKIVFCLTFIIIDSYFDYDRLEMRVYKKVAKVITREYLNA